MNNASNNFMNELLEDVIQEEVQSTQVYMSLLVKKVAHMQKQIGTIFLASDEEVKIIKNFALSKSAKIQGQIDGISSVLEAYIRDLNEKDPTVKTVDFTDGSIKLRRSATKIVIDNMDIFLANANDNLMNKSVKPSLSKIKAVAKLSGRLPLGCVKIEPTEDDFSLKINEV
jgi:DNA-binding FrmR family transcriptional regulator